MEITPGDPTEYVGFENSESLVYLFLPFSEMT